MAGRNQTGTVTVVTLRLLSAAAKRSVQFNSAFLINSTYPANAWRLRGQWQSSCQCAAVSHCVEDYILSSGSFLPPLWRGLQPRETRAASPSQNKENVLGSRPLLSLRKTQHHYVFSFQLSASDSCSFHC